MTEWRNVVGFDGYMVSDDGQVMSIARYIKSDRHRSGRQLIRQRILKSFGDGHGYQTVQLTGQKKRKVHQLVADAFLGPCPPGHEVRHLDGDRSHNVKGNLAHGTRAQNVADAIEHGTFTRGEKNGVAKLLNSQVSAIKKRLLNGASTGLLAKEFGVSPQAISSIRSGRNWAHIEVAA
jgi:hypothetical protein